MTFGSLDGLDPHGLQPLFGGVVAVSLAYGMSEGNRKAALGLLVPILWAKFQSRLKLDWTVPFDAVILYSYFSACYGIFV